MILTPASDTPLYVWLTVTFLTQPEPREKLLSFYRRVRPNPAMWGPIAAEATDIVPQKDGVFNLLNWISGVVMIYAFLFGTGNIILGSTPVGAALLAVGFVFGAFIYYRINKRGWEVLSS